MSKAKKRLLILFSLFSLSFVMMAFQHNRRPFSFFEVLSYPFHALSKITSSVDLKVKTAKEALEENTRLKKELTAFLLERQKYNEVIQENKRLKDLLSLKEHELRYLTAAKVIARGYDKVLNTIILDKGGNNGLQKGMAVITTRGLVGKVYFVKNDFAEVLLLRDSNFSVAVRLQNNRREGVVSGTGYDNCVLKYISPEENVEKGEVIVTSGLDGIFPPGLPVGTVVKVKKEGVEFFQQIEIMPFQSDAKLEEVVILKQE